MISLWSSLTKRLHSLGHVYCRGYGVTDMVLLLYNNKIESNSPNTLNDRNYQAPSQNFRQIILWWFYSLSLLELFLGNEWSVVSNKWHCSGIFLFDEISVSIIVLVLLMYIFWFLSSPLVWWCLLPILSLDKRTCTKGVQDKAWLGGKGDPLGIVQEIEIWSYYQMLHAQTRIRQGEWITQNSRGFFHTNRSHNTDQT